MIASSTPARPLARLLRFAGRSLWLCAFAAVLTVGDGAHAVPVQLPYKARLLNAADQPVTESLSVAFRIFRTPDPEANELPLFHELCDVHVYQGLLEAVIGGPGCAEGALRSVHIPLNEPRYLEISIDDETLTPRLALHRVPVVGTAFNVDFLGQRTAQEIAWQEDLLWMEENIGEMAEYALADDFNQLKEDFEALPDFVLPETMDEARSSFEEVASHYLEHPDAGDLWGGTILWSSIDDTPIDAYARLDGASFYGPVVLESPYQVRFENGELDEEEVGRDLESMLRRMEDRFEEGLNELAARSGTCPLGYEQDESETRFVLCRRGNNEMVRVGSFWIDRYELTLVNEARWADGYCSETEGRGFIDVYRVQHETKDKNTLADSGHWAPGSELYACSMKSVPLWPHANPSTMKPSTSLTMLSAQQACSLAGKRLCRNDEWQQAVAGTIDPGFNDGSDGRCLTQGTRGPLGARPECRSLYGAEDMIGNVAELTADWWQAGLGGNPDPEARSGEWPEDYVYEFILGVTTPDPGEAVLDGETLVTYHGDALYNVNGRSEVSVGPHGRSGFGVPGVAARGGTGAFSMHLLFSAGGRGASAGARCCLGR